MIKLRDIIIIVLLLGVAGLALVVANKGEGNIAVVEHNGVAVQRVDFSSLSDEITVETNGTVIVIDKSGARFVRSVCPSQVCVKGGTINKVGQILVCLPQRVSVRIEGEGEPEFDAMTG